VNIWLVFVPGAAATIIEKIIREASTHKTLPPAYREFDKSRTDLYAVPADGAMNSHTFRKQWHPCTVKDLLAGPAVTAEVNVFTPIVPMPEWSGTRILEYIYSIKTDNDYLFYLGPTEENIDFQRIAHMKAPNDYMASKTIPATRWEHRELISQTNMQWYIPCMKESETCAKRLGYQMFDVKDIFTNLKDVCRDIIERTGGSISDRNRFDNLCDDWSNNQYTIFDKYDRLTKYKDVIIHNVDHNVTLDSDILLEAMIQYYLREQGIELLCYGLNDFPNSKNIAKYYDI